MLMTHTMRVMMWLRLPDPSLIDQQKNSPALWFYSREEMNMKSQALMRATHQTWAWKRNHYSSEGDVNRFKLRSVRSSSCPLAILSAASHSWCSKAHHEAKEHNSLRWPSRLWQHVWCVWICEWALKPQHQTYVGCEFYVIYRSQEKLKFTKDDPDKRYNQFFWQKIK